MRLTNLPPSVSRLSRKCGGLDVSQRYGPSWAATGIALPIFYRYTGQHVSRIYVRSEVPTAVTKKVTIVYPNLKSIDQFSEIFNHESLSNCSAVVI
jgi:hypothetical protein